MQVLYKVGIGVLAGIAPLTIANRVGAFEDQQLPTAEMSCEVAPIGGLALSKEALVEPCPQESNNLEQGEPMLKDSLILLGELASGAAGGLVGLHISMPGIRRYTKRYTRAAKFYLGPKSHIV